MVLNLPNLNSLHIDSKSCEICEDTNLRLPNLKHLFMKGRFRNINLRGSNSCKLDIKSTSVKIHPMITFA